MSSQHAAVVDRPEASRYELDVDGQVAFLDYRRRDGHVMLVHTEVPESLRGRGLASLLARHALDAARAEGAKVVVRCPYVTSWLQRHPEYGAMIVERVPDSSTPRAN